ncbi:MAG: hypothetical protein QOI78_9193 [Actinomycetota bacterium]|nr:hypothetical protein [Actinomycetota bacterium]
MNPERTAAELADDAFAAPDPGYGGRLALIRASAAADGVALVVDLHGALVELRFERWALNRTPGELAGLVKRLAAEAAADALRQGREVLGEVLPEDEPERVWGPETRPVRAVEPEPRDGQAWGPETRPVRPAPDDDSFTPATWAT